MKKQSFTQGIITLMVSQIFVKILGLLYRLYLTNKTEFGDAGNAIYSSGFQIYALLLTVSSIGVPNTMSKLISEKLSIGDEYNADRIFKVSFAIFSCLGFLSSVILFVFSGYIANNILEIPEAKLTLQALAPSIFFVSIISVFRGYFNARENMKPTANSQIIEQIVKTVLIITIVEIICIYVNVKNKTEIMAAGANIATTLATFISYLYLRVYLRKNSIKINKLLHNFKKEKTKKIIQNIFSVSIPIMLTAILGTINKNIDSITVVRGLKSFLTAEEAKIQYGILSGKVDTLITLPMSFNIAITTALVPTIASAFIKKETNNIKSKIESSLLLTLLIGLPASVGMILYAGPILKLLFPNAYSGTLVYQISSLSIIFVLLNQTINGILQGIGKQSYTVIALLCGSIVKLIINIYCVPLNNEEFIFGGINAAAIGSVLCYFTSMILNIIFLKKNLKIKINLNSIILKPLICTTIMATLSYLLYIQANKFLEKNIATIITLGFAIIIYLLLCIKLKLLKKPKFQGN